jgi:ferric-dicitrate binding protein FerR (iron transport regulator)
MRCAILKRERDDVPSRSCAEDLTMMSRAHRIVHALALSTSIAALSTTAFAASDIGKATAITTSVTASLASASTTLKSGDDVFQDQIITTDAKGVGQFTFRDGTKLAVGPGSVLVLDNFVYESDTSKARVVINLTEGALRFMTGKANHDAYEIVTPVATIGVRGTAFDVYANLQGEMALAMIDGTVEVCPKGGACRLHNVIGKFLHMTPAGIFSLRDTWDGSFLTGVPITLALPFISDQGALLPAMRGKTATIRRYATNTGKTIEKAVKVPLTKLPKIKLPNPFK